MESLSSSKWRVLLVHHKKSGNFSLSRESWDSLNDCQRAWEPAEREQSKADTQQAVALFPAHFHTKPLTHYSVCIVIELITRPLAFSCRVMICTVEGFEVLDNKSRTGEIYEPNLKTVRMSSVLFVCLSVCLFSVCLLWSIREEGEILLPRDYAPHTLLSLSPSNVFFFHFYF